MTFNIGSSKRPAVLKAFLASFAVYLIPIVGPHAGWLVGQYLLSRLSRSGSTSVAAWIASEWMLALGLQAVAGVLWYRFFARPKWPRLLPVVVCVPVFFVVLEWCYLVGIPSRFLIEQDTAPESGEWRTVCTVPDLSVAQVRSTPGLLERAGQAWLAGKENNEYAVLEMPGCATMPLVLQRAGPSYTQPFVLPDCRCVFRTSDNKTGQDRWWYTDAGGSAPRPLPHVPSDPNRSAPVLSEDGGSVAWLEYIPGARTSPLPERVSICSLHDDRQRYVNMPSPGRSSFTLLGLNTATENLVFYEYEYSSRQSSFSVFGFDGARRGQPSIAEGVDPQPATLARAGQGWVAWDAYRENEPYRVAWSLPTGGGTHRVLKGRGINSVAVNPRGTYVAVSATTALNIGHIKDSVYVLRTSDGAEVWRRYLPTYTRSSLAFLGDGFLAYTDWDGSRVAVRVLEVPTGE